MSTAQILFTPARLEELLNASRANNARLGITGLLLFRDGTFLQLLEGPQAAVDALFRKIKADERHYAIVTLVEGTTAQRHFPKTPMEFRNLRDSSVQKIPGFEEFQDVPLSESEFSYEPARAMRLMRLFGHAR